MSDLYRPKFRSQFDDDHKAWDPFDCGYAASAMLIDYVTAGLVRPVPHDVRSRAGDLEIPRTGSTLSELYHGIVRLAGPGPNRFSVPWETFLKRLRRGRPAVLNIRAGELPRQWRGAKIRSFTGAHSVFVLTADELRATVADPGGLGYERMPLKQLAKAATAYARDGRAWGIMAPLDRDDAEGPQDPEPVDPELEPPLVPEGPQDPEPVDRGELWTELSDSYGRLLAAQGEFRELLTVLAYQDELVFPLIVTSPTLD